MAVTAVDVGRFRHLALFYHGRGDYLAALGGFIQTSRARGDAVFVAVPEHKARLVRRELGDDSAQVTLVDMAELGRNPARIIPAVLTYASQHRGRRVCYIGEPIWPGRTAAERQEATRHEALINLAFRRPARLPLSASTAAPGFRDRSLPMRQARTRPSSRTGRRRPAPGTWVRQTFRRDVIGRCHARPRTPRRWTTVTTWAQFAASSPAGPSVPGSRHRASPTWCSLSASSPATPCATLMAAEPCRSGEPEKRSSAR